MDCRGDAEILTDLRQPWPWADNSVDEACSSHFLEHLTASERIHFANELYRVLKPGAECHILIPHWANASAYGDLTHQWPPVSEAWFAYLNKAWREINAPHNDFYTCDFTAQMGYTHNPNISDKKPKKHAFMLAHCRDAVQDLAVDLTKPPGY